jgi:hypothetical protein
MSQSGNKLRTGEIVRTMYRQENEQRALSGADPAKVADWLDEREFQRPSGFVPGATSNELFLPGSTNNPDVVRLRCDFDKRFDCPTVDPQTKSPHQVPRRSGRHHYAGVGLSLLLVQ